MTSVEPNFVSYALLAHTGLHILFTSQEDLKKSEEKFLSQVIINSTLEVSNFTESSFYSKNIILMS